MFSARLYGSRSHKTKQLLADLRGEESKEEEVVTKSMPIPEGRVGALIEHASLRRDAEKAKGRRCLLAHKIALDPNAEQRLYFVRAAGTARFAWNWALAEWKRQYKAGERPTEVSLRRQLNAIKREQFPWMYDVTKAAAQEAIIDLGSAFRAFFEKRGRYPRFKRKDDRASFCAANEVGTFRTNGKRIKLPVIGWVKMREAVRFTGSLKRATVSCEAGRWFVALQIETDDVKRVTQPEAEVGIDLGVSALATLSTGEIIVGPKSHAVALKQLRRASRAFSRKRRGSANARKAKARLARLQRRIANIRRDSTHKLTTRVTKTFAVIGIEDLNVRGMLRNRRLARSIADGGFYELRRQIDYKARLYGARVIVADRWYPSSKTCSCCGVIKETLALAERTFRCDDCSFEIARDINAARNLAHLAASSAVSACGVERAGPIRKNRVKRSKSRKKALCSQRPCNVRPERSSEFSERSILTVTAENGGRDAAWPYNCICGADKIIPSAEINALVQAELVSHQIGGSMPHELGASGNRNGLIAFEPRLKTARRVARSPMDFHFSSYKLVTALAPSRAWDPQFLDLKI